VGEVVRVEIGQSLSRHVEPLDRPVALEAQDHVVAGVSSPLDRAQGQRDVQVAGEEIDGLESTERVGSGGRARRHARRGHEVRRRLRRRARRQIRAREAGRRDLHVADRRACVVQRGVDRQ